MNKIQIEYLTGLVRTENRRLRHALTLETTREEANMINEEIKLGMSVLLQLNKEKK